MTNKPKRTEIDRDKLRVEIRRLGNESIFYILDDAIELLSPAKLHMLAKKYFDLKRLRPDAEPVARPSLLAGVKRFEKASLAGDYYESFFVNSKNYMQKSPGTIAWIGEFRRLLKYCVINAAERDASEVRDALDILFALLDHVDECHDDVIFFADEGGSWQVGVDWEKVLPVWFKAISATAKPAEYTERITSLLSRHYAYRQDKMLAIALRTATAEQRKALAALAILEKKKA